MNGSPALGPGTYAVERAETLTFPAPQGGAGDADPSRPSLPFRIRYTPFDTRHLASGYKTLKPRFSTPRTTLHASELPGGARGVVTDLSDDEPSAITAAERTAGELFDSRGGVKKRLTPAAKVSSPLPNRLFFFHVGVMIAARFNPTRAQRFTPGLPHAMIAFLHKSV